jgi:membrane protease YdiL (CAAX protease family)
VSANVTATVMGLVIALFGPMLLAIASERFISPQSSLVWHMLAMGVYLAIVATVLFIIFRYENQSLLSIGVRPFRWQTLAWGLVLAAFFMYVFTPAASWTLARFELGGFEHGLAKSAALPVWYLSIGVMFGGIAEEFLYRGYAIERIAALTGSYWIAGTVSVLIFGLAHAPTWGWGPALATVVSGAVATLFYIWQRDLLAIMIAHVITDLSGIVIVPFLARMKMS